jgi:hypothetical protein
MKFWENTLLPSSAKQIASKMQGESIVCSLALKMNAIYCDMFRSSTVVARQWEVKNVSMDMIDSPTILDGWMATKNGIEWVQKGCKQVT